MASPDTAWRDDVAAALPTAGPEGDGDLRADLVDEIADHLECALQRERMHDEDETTARDRVLERFGDPRAVMRQLWFDAIRERLVGQRITMIAAVVLAVAALATCGIAWSIASGVQRTNEQLLAKSEEANRALLELLAKRPEPVAAAVPPVPVSLDWNRLVVQLVVDGTDEPVEGWSVEVSGHLHSETEEANVRERSGDDGRADLGFVRPGGHRVRVLTPWNESTSFTYTVRPGEEAVVRVKCPPAAPPATTVQLDFDVPRWDTLRGAGYGVLVEFSRGAREFSDAWWHDGTDYGVLMSPDGTLVRYEGVSGDRDTTVRLYGETTPLPERRLDVPVGQYAASVRIVDVDESRDVGELRELTVIAPTSRHDRLFELTGRGTFGVGGSPTAPEASPQVLTAGENESVWAITVPRRIVALGWSTVVADGTLPRGSTGLTSLLRFFHADEDEDGRLTEAEYNAAFGSTETPVPSEEVETEWPVGPTEFLDELERRRRTRIRPPFPRP